VGAADAIVAAAQGAGRARARPLGARLAVGGRADRRAGAGVGGHSRGEEWACAANTATLTAARRLPRRPAIDRERRLCRGVQPRGRLAPPIPAEQTGQRAACPAAASRVRGSGWEW